MTDPVPDFLPDLPVDRIMGSLRLSPGHEIRTGKFDSPESSAALVANAFGWFLTRPASLPHLPGVPAGAVLSVELESEMRYPWAGGGRHPWLNVGLATQTTLIGIRARRYEPFRPAKNTGFADVYDRPVWGPNMNRYTQLQRDLVEGAVEFECLDAVQLVKDAYGIRTRAEKRALGAVLVYLYAEPALWANGKPVDPARIAQHRREVAAFSKAVAGDNCVFVPVRWTDLLHQWSKMPALKAHVLGLRAKFGF